MEGHNLRFAGFVKAVELDLFVVDYFTIELVFIVKGNTRGGVDEFSKSLYLSGLVRRVSRLLDYRCYDFVLAIAEFKLAPDASVLRPVEDQNNGLHSWICLGYRSRRRGCRMVKAIPVQFEVVVEDSGLEITRLGG